MLRVTACQGGRTCGLAPLLIQEGTARSRRGWSQHSVGTNGGRYDLAADRNQNAFLHAWPEDFPRRLIFLGEK
jgi:hypothetical protein